MRRVMTLGVVAMSLLAGCGSTSDTSGGTAPAGVTSATASVVAATAGAAPTAAAPPITTTSVPPASPVATPLDAGTYGSVNAAAAALLAAPAGLEEATSGCAATGDCTAAQAIAGTVRAAVTQVSVLLITAASRVQRGTTCQRVISDFSDAVVHRYGGRLDDFFARFTEVNAQRLADAGTRVGQVADDFKAACAPSAP